MSDSSELLEKENLLRMLEESEEEKEQLIKRISELQQMIESVQQPLLNQLLQQESLLREKNDLIASLNEENKKLLSVAEEGKTLSENNKKLSEEIQILKMQVDLQNKTNGRFQNLINDQAEKITEVANRVPTLDTLYPINESLKTILKNAEGIQRQRRSNILEVAFIIIMLVVNSVFLYKMLDNTDKTISNTYTLYRGIFNKEGFSTLDGSISNYEHYHQNEQK